MLEAAVKEMKGESSEERPATQLNLGIALRIDESYVPEENQRLRLYKKIAGATSEAAVNEVRAEMEDRYGKPPDATVYLLEASLIRLECERIGIAQIDRKRAELHIRFTENAAVDPRSPDAPGGAQRQARRAVHAAGRVEVSRWRTRGRRCSAGDSGTDCGGVGTIPPLRKKDAQGWGTQCCWRS
jgi:transcription-repair coupling factor (superfamily II helicase)